MPTQIKRQTEARVFPGSSLVCHPQAWSHLLKFDAFFAALSSPPPSLRIQLESKEHQPTRSPVRSSQEKSSWLLLSFRQAFDPSTISLAFIFCHPFPPPSSPQHHHHHRVPRARPCAMPTRMADIKPPSPVRVECRYTMCSSGDKANLECLQCYLVGYCSEECALKDRSQHSEFCERHRSRMNVEYDPKEDLDRFLSGPDEKSSLRPDERTSGRVLASRAGHPKLIATDATDSFSLGSIDRRLGARVSILTEGMSIRKFADAIS